MPQLIIDVPETLMPLLTRKAEVVRETPEEFIVSYLSVNLEHDGYDSAQSMVAAEQERLEDILEERDKGPFITITDTKALKERVMARALARIQRESRHG